MKQGVLWAVLGTALFMGGVLLGHHLPREVPVGSAAASGEKPNHVAVVPESLSESPSLEIGDLILLLIPKPSERVDWDYRADSSIMWVTSGFKESAGAIGETVTTREGAVRVNVMGQTTTVLQQRRMELGWSVTYRGARPAKFGPSEIKIEPGVQEPCFGTAFDGCEFEPLHSLAHAGVTAHQICDVQIGADQTRVYLLTYPQRRSVTLIWYTSGGSGGTSSWLTLETEEKYQPELACTKLRVGETVTGAEGTT